VARGIASSDATSLARRLRRMANEIDPQPTTARAMTGTKPGSMAGKGGAKGGGKKKRAATRSRVQQTPGTSPL
jgi:hypothetical protein